MKDIDLIAGTGAIVYAITAGVLMALGIVDLGEYVAQPRAAGAFGVVALGRWYKRRAEAKAIEAADKEKDE